MIVFHIPHFRVKGKNLIEVDYYKFQKELMQLLSSNGVRYELSGSTETVNGIDFTEGICLCDSNSIKIIVCYIRLLRKYHPIFQHTFYLYEMNGISHKIIIKDKEIIHL